MSLKMIKILCLLVEGASADYWKRLWTASFWMTEFKATPRIRSKNFIFYWPCISVQFLLITNLTHFSFPMYLFHFSTCFEQSSVHHQENQLYQYIIWYISLSVGPSGPAYQTVTYTEWHIPDDVLIQLILLMMSTGLLETCRKVK